MQIGVVLHQLVRAQGYGRCRVLAPLRDNAPLHSWLRAEGVMTGYVISSLDFPGSLPLV